jgi:hypothetical protein
VPPDGLPVTRDLTLAYALYTYALYLVGAPFSTLFLPYVALVAVSAYTTMQPGPRRWPTHGRRERRLSSAIRAEPTEEVH